MKPDVEDFLAHVGVKGMRWGVKRTDAQLARASGQSSGGSSTGESDAKPQGMSKKKKIAIGVGIVGGVALIAAGSYAVNKQIDVNRMQTLASTRQKAETRLAGEKAARAQIQAFGKKSKWQLMNELPNQPKSTPAKAAPARGNRGQRKAKANADAFASKSKYQLMSELPSRSSKTAYSKRDVKKDTKTYGTKGAARIQARVNKGVLLSEARKKEASRQYGVKAARVAFGVSSASRREAAEYNRLRRGK